MTKVVIKKKIHGRKTNKNKLKKNENTLFFKIPNLRAPKISLY